MNRPIRRVGYAVTVLILLLVAQLTYLQVVDADNLANDPRNVRKQLKDYNRARGEILTADGQIVAESVPTTGDFKYQRVYPQGGLFAQIVGYQSFVNLVGTTGVEESYNDVLTGQDTEPAAAATSATCSTGRRRRTTWCSPSPRARSATAEQALARASAARWSRST